MITAVAAIFLAFVVLIFWLGGLGERGAKG